MKAADLVRAGLLAEGSIVVLETSHDWPGGLARVIALADPGVPSMAFEVKHCRTAQERVVFEDEDVELRV